MVVLNRGDYVLVKDEGVGRITVTDFNPCYHLVWMLDERSPMSILRHKHYLTPIDPALIPILSDSTKGES